MNFTFKKHARSTGLARVGNPYSSTDIKMGGKWCGTIHAPNWRSKDNNYRIMLMVYPPNPSNPNCEWEWITLKFKSDDEKECREFLKANFGTLNEKYKIRCDDD